MKAQELLVAGSHLKSVECFRRGLRTTQNKKALFVLLPFRASRMRFLQQTRYATKASLCVERCVSQSRALDIGDVCPTQIPIIHACSTLVSGPRPCQINLRCFDTFIEGHGCIEFLLVWDKWPCPQVTETSSLVCTDGFDRLRICVETKASKAIHKPSGHKACLMESMSPP